jgi:thymidylate synthase ThyX
MNKIDVLDHGFVRLVEHMGSDVSIARAARNSYDAAWRAGEDEGSDTKLLRYLMRNRHTSPFEAVVMTFEVKAAPGAITSLALVTDHYRTSSIYLILAPSVLSPSRTSRCGT